ncbi:MAG: ATP-binding protein [Candidatus Eremiobacteraeota bacterium]|mgnify:CR=1 FL=1|nr:ATP-binding protein [Candidatus Eremiobacteraeota bacterium]
MQANTLVVASNPPCSPLEFYVQVTLPQELPLDEVVHTSRNADNWGKIFYYGVVQSLTRSTPGSYLARVRILRIEPELYVPPEPGAPVYRSDPKVQQLALRFDGMKRRLVAGLMADGQPAYVNLDFLSGVSGAHVNIAGISGVATKTSYALFLLYSLFQSTTVETTRAIIFNVKSNDLLHLHHPNARLSHEARSTYQRLGLPCQPFSDVGYSGGSAPLWSMREFAEKEYFRFLFSDDEQTDTQEFAIEHIVDVLKEEAAKTSGPELVVLGQTIASLKQLCALISGSMEESDSLWFGKAATNTRLAIGRRLRGAAAQISSLLSPVPCQGFSYSHQLNVVDLHLYTDKARAFVVGCILKNLFDGREALGDAHPTVYLVLDELNKYAPRQGYHRIRDMLLDVAERGRSLGIVLIGAEQTASAVEERVVGNSALRVVGRLEAAESQKDCYGWLTEGLRERAVLLQPGAMFLSQPEVPVPLAIRFPFPAWATRSSEVAAG